MKWAMACIGSLLASLAFALDRSQLGLVINSEDPLSVQVGAYYAAQRRIPFQNVIRVGFPPGAAAMGRAEFEAIKASVDHQAGPAVQAYALTWAAPYRVECMSITSAFAFGFDASYCADGCKGTRRSPYFNSPARLPFTQLRMRPTMALAAESFERAKQVIDRGVASDGSFPAGTAYLMSTSDSARNVRSTTYPLVARMLGNGGRVRSRILTQDFLGEGRDVLFYFTGLSLVGGIDRLHYLPGAIADHLTSAGGMLTDSPQMSALRWLEAGATGSYGTVVEPCSIPQKFPYVPVVVARYLQGETLIEAYWKSVAMPGQGIFIGEPLAAPFGHPSGR